MSDLLAQYYKGITQQLQAEVDLINSLFEHQGVKGGGNEAVLRDFLAKFIPKKYSVGTGIVIDRDGKPSRQCDIVIYDDLSYPSFLSLTSAQFFPIDIVYTIIEVKTTLNSKEAKLARRNIASVRNLAIPKQFMDPPPISRETTSGERVYNNWEYSPPAGCVFAYKSDVRTFKTFKNWFTPKGDKDIPKEYPTLVGCLDQGIVRFKDTYPREGKKPRSLTFPVRDDKTGSIVEPKSARGSGYYQEVSYPIKKAKGKNILVDQSRILIAFLFYLIELLRIREMNPRVELPIHYLNTLEESAWEA